MTWFKVNVDFDLADLMLRTVAELTAANEQFARVHNRHLKPFVWTASA